MRHKSKYKSRVFKRGLKKQKRKNRKFNSYRVTRGGIRL